MWRNTEERIAKDRAKTHKTVTLSSAQVSGSITTLAIIYIGNEMQYVYIVIAIYMVPELIAKLTGLLILLAIAS